MNNTNKIGFVCFGEVNTPYERLQLKHDEALAALQQRFDGLVDGGIVIVSQLDLRAFRRAIRHQAVIALCKGGAVLAMIQPQLHVLDPMADFFHTAGKLRSEDNGIRIGQVQTITDLICGIAVV